jgi:hypothetical protein
MYFNIILRTSFQIKTFKIFKNTIEIIFQCNVTNQLNFKDKKSRGRRGDINVLKETTASPEFNKES